MTLKFIFSRNRFQPNQRERTKVKASLPSLFLQQHKVPFNDHIFLHENAWPFSGLCFGVVLIIAWCIFLISNAFIFLTLEMLAPGGYSLEISYRHLSILCRGARRPGMLLFIILLTEPGPEDKQEAVSGEATPYPVVGGVEFRSWFCRFEPERLLGIMECRRNLYHLWSE